MAQDWNNNAAQFNGPRLDLGRAALAQQLGAAAPSGSQTARGGGTRPRICLKNAKVPVEEARRWAEIGRARSTGARSRRKSPGRAKGSGKSRGEGAADDGPANADGIKDAEGSSTTATDNEAAAGQSFSMADDSDDEDEGEVFETIGEKIHGKKQDTHQWDIEQLYEFDVDKLVGLARNKAWGLQGSGEASASQDAEGSSRPQNSQSRRQSVGGGRSSQGPRQPTIQEGEELEGELDMLRRQCHQNDQMVERLRRVVCELLARSEQLEGQLSRSQHSERALRHQLQAQWEQSQGHHDPSQRQQHQQQWRQHSNHQQNGNFQRQQRPDWPQQQQPPSQWQQQQGQWQQCQPQQQPRMQQQQMQQQQIQQQQQMQPHMQQVQQQRMQQQQTQPHMQQMQQMQHPQMQQQGQMQQPQMQHMSPENMQQQGQMQQPQMQQPQMQQPQMQQGQMQQGQMQQPQMQQSQMQQPQMQQMSPEKMQQMQMQQQQQPQNDGSPPPNGAFQTLQLVPMLAVPVQNNGQHFQQSHGSKAPQSARYHREMRRQDADWAGQDEMDQQSGGQSPPLNRRSTNGMGGQLPAWHGGHDFGASQFGSGNRSPGSPSSGGSNCNLPLSPASDPFRSGHRAREPPAPPSHSPCVGSATSSGARAPRPARMLQGVDDLAPLPGQEASWGSHAPRQPPGVFSQGPMSARGPNRGPAQQMCQDSQHAAQGSEPQEGAPSTPRQGRSGSKGPRRLKNKGMVTQQSQRGHSAEPQRSSNSSAPVVPKLSLGERLGGGGNLPGQTNDDQAHDSSYGQKVREFDKPWRSRSDADMPRMPMSARS